MVKEKQHLFKIWKRPKKCKKGCRCRKTGGQKLCEHGRKAGNKGCNKDMETRRQDYNQAKGAAKRAINKANNVMMRGMKFCKNLERG